MTPDDLPNLTELALQAPPVVRAAVGTAGAVLLLFGARLYRPGLLLGAFGAGAVGAVGALQTLAAWVPAAAEPTTVAVGAVSTGLVGAVVAHLAHKLALVVVGSLLGLLGAASLLALVVVPWWVVPCGAVVGAVTLPWVYPHLLKVLTPALGACLVAWALGRLDAVWLVAALWTVGAVVQVRTAKKKDASA